MRSEDMLPEGTDVVERNGVTIRKGSVGAFIANVRLLDEPDLSEDARAQILADMRELVPPLQAVGLFDAFEARDPAVRSLIAETLAAEGNVSAG